MYSTPYDLIVVADRPDVRELLYLHLRAIGLVVAVFELAEFVLADHRARALLLDLSTAKKTGRAVRYLRADHEAPIGAFMTRGVTPPAELTSEAKVLWRPVRLSQIRQFLLGVDGLTPAASAFRQSGPSRGPLS